MGEAITQRTILVVEDEALIRMSTVATLEDAGYCVLEAQNSPEALQILSRHAEVSILVTDVRMSGAMDGLALVAQVRLDHPAIRAIVVSGTTSATEAIDAGALGFLTKPYMAHTLVQAVHDTVLRH
jgi:two-component system, response regulator PdtaR